jgi:hypothetical protein
MKRTFVIFGLVLALLLSFSFAPAATSTAYAQPGGGLLTNIPVTGDLNGGTFEGLLSITGFAFENGELLVSGILTGTATQGGIVTEITQTFTNIATGLFGGGQRGRCDILFLDLGPIFLDVLGLEVDLSQIVLDIDAVRGPGNLLGNLLCAVVGLLDAGGPLAGITNLLNRINNLLG